MRRETIDNVGTCHRCLMARGSASSSPPACPVSRLPITLHAHRGDCPEGRHAAGVTLGDVPPGWDGRDYRKDSQGGAGCNCA